MKKLSFSAYIKELIIKDMQKSKKESEWLYANCNYSYWVSATLFVLLKPNGEKRDNDVTRLIKTCNIKAQQTKPNQNKTIL
jgi:hypothetical protein